MGDGEGRRHCRNLEAATFQILDLAQAEQPGKWGEGEGGHSWDLTFLGSAPYLVLAVLASHSHVRCLPYIHPQDFQNIKKALLHFAGEETEVHRRTKDILMLGRVVHTRSPR